MSAVEALLARRAARPILLGGDPLASLRAFAPRALAEAGASLGRVVRDAPAAVSELHHRELVAGVDVLTALTAETTAPSLGRVGMAFRAAALTGAAVELADHARKLAPRPVVLAGVLGVPRSLGDARRDEELSLHAARLSATGCELILARGGAPALTCARDTNLPIWLIVEVDDTGRALGGDPVERLAQRARDAGASALLIDAPSLASARAALDAVSATPLPLGALLHAPHVTCASAAWADEALQLIDEGVKIIGGGLGTTTETLARLRKALTTKADPGEARS